MVNTETYKEFAQEQQSWGDFPFDKPHMNMEQYMDKQLEKEIKQGIRKLRLHNFMYSVNKFITELFTVDMKKQIRYPLI